MIALFLLLVIAAIVLGILSGWSPRGCCSCCSSGSSSCLGALALGRLADGGGDQGGAPPGYLIRTASRQASSPVSEAALARIWATWRSMSASGSSGTAAAANSASASLMDSARRSISPSV